MGVTLRESASPNRANKEPLLDGYLCPYCLQYQRTKGWLLWHINHKHTIQELKSYSRGQAGGIARTTRYDGQKYAHMVRR
jgi:hypothetical protein